MDTNKLHANFVKAAQQYDRWQSQHVRNPAVALINVLVALVSTEIGFWFVQNVACRLLANAVNIMERMPVCQCSHK